MDINQRKDLVLGLYSELTGYETGTPKTKKYFEDTQTLYSQGKEIKAVNGKVVKEVRFKVDVDTYNKIARDEKRFFITNENLIPGMEVFFDELDGLKITGRCIIKNIRYVESYLDNKGLSEGFCIIGW